MNRRSLVDQVVDHVCGSIAEGVWQDWLPSQRRLERELQVSRNTIQAAFLELKNRGVVSAVHNRGYRVLKASRRKAPLESGASVAILLPEPLRMMRPNVGLWIDTLRAILSESGIRLQIIVSPAAYRANGPRPLQRLVASHGVSCWVVLRGSRKFQNKIEAEKLPCVIAGSCNPGIRLPAVDIDFRSVAKHATNLLLVRGHRKIAIVRDTTLEGGELYSEEGFHEAMENHRSAETEEFAISYEGNVDQLIRSLRFYFRREPRPTAVVITQSYCYLTVFLHLQGAGYRIPEDISLVSLTDDNFFEYIRPRPTRYVFDPDHYARKVARAALKVAKGIPIAAETASIFPSLERGDSVAQLRES